MAKKKKITNNPQQEEKHDFFIEISHTIFTYIENHRKQFIIGLSGFLLLIVVVSLLYVFKSQKDAEISNLFFDANTNFTSHIEEIRSDKIRGTLTDTEINQIKKGFINIIDKSESRPESHLSHYNLGIISFSSQNFDEAVIHFNKASQQSSFPLAFLAQYNKAQTFFNKGYLLQKDNNFDGANKEYQDAYKYFSEIEKEFPDSPIIPLSYRGRGLVKEYMAKCYTALNQRNNAKKALEEGKEDYKKLINYSNKEKDSFNATNELSAFAMTDPKQEGEIGLRRIEIKLQNLSK